MIYYVNNKIYDWNFEDDNIVKVYRDGVVCYYKMVAGSTAQTPCYAVTDDITQYSDTEFIDVFDKATEKWYKLNNLNEYEEYGVYGDSISTGRLPEGYTEVEYVANTGTSSVNLGIQLQKNVGDTFEVITDQSMQHSNDLGRHQTFMACAKEVNPYYGWYMRYSAETSTIDYRNLSGNFTTARTNVSGSVYHTVFSGNTRNDKQHDRPFTVFSTLDSGGTEFRFCLGRVYNMDVYYNGSLARNLVPCQRDSDDTYGLYDLVGETFYSSTTSTPLSGGNEVYAGATYYEGKLAIVDDKEYIYSGSGWTYVGDVTGTTITIMSPEYLEKDASHKGTIMSDKKFTENSKVQLKVHPTNGSGSALFGDYGTSDNNDIRLFWLGNTIYWDLINQRVNTTLSTGNTYELELGNNYIKNLATSAVITSGTRATFASERSCPLDVFGGGVSSNCEPSVTNEYGRLYWFKLYDSDTLVLDLIPYVDNDGYGMFDKVSKTKYPQSTAYHSLTASSVVNEVNVGDSVYPLYYTVKQDPPQNLVFTDMAEAEAYACPYEGLMATIGGDLYAFSKVGNDYEWVALAYTLSGTTKSSTDFTLKINGANVTATVYEDNGDNTYNWGVVYTDPISSVTQMASGNTNLLTFDWGTADTSQLTSIGNEAFRGCSAMTSMPSIPSGVTSFGDHSFRGCYNMNSNGSIVIPEGVVSIGSESFNGVFNYSSSPRSIYLPSTLTSVGGGAFTNRQYLSSTYVTSLSSYMKIDFGTADSVPFYANNNFNFYVNGVRTTSIVVPSDVTELKNYTFYRLRTLTSVTIPNTVTKWDGAGTFSNSGLRTATIASDSSLAKIGAYAFDSTYLTGFTVPSSISRIEASAFSNITSLTSFTIPSNVTYIGDYAFNGCNRITAITIPSSVSTMNRYAFRNCTGMTSVTMESSTPPSVYAGVFEGYGCPIYVPCNAVSAYRSAYNWGAYTYRIVGYESCTTYQWVSAAGEYYCDNGDKYSLEKYQRSFDGGTTWEDTGDYRLDTLIETGSADCNTMSLDEYIAASSTGASGNNIVISPVISGVKRLVVDLTERDTNGNFCYLNVRDSVNANLMLSISSYSGTTTLMYGSAWSYPRPYSIIEAASNQDITWCYYDKIDKNKIIFDFEAYDSTKTFIIESWQKFFNTPFVVEIWV